MSERMIEMHRAKLLGQTPPKGTPMGQPQNLTQAPRVGTQPQQAKSAEKLSPADAALRKLQREDVQMQRFIHRLQRRNDSHPSFESISGSTVPTALARRMLHRQGVGYLDDTVGAVVSASADRFLATVLQQGIACRDQRLKGMVLAKEAERQRKRHMQHYDEETIDRKRRREQSEENREKEHLAAIAAGEALNKKGGKADDKKKKKKKGEEAQAPTNGAAKKSAKKDDDDDASYDSIDEEEEYYRNNNQDTDSWHLNNSKNDEDEEDDTILLRDLQRPLEAWKFNLLGKESLEAYSSEEEEEDNDESEDDEPNNDTSMMDDNPNDESLLFQGIMESGNASSKQSDDGDKAKRKSNSPKS